MEPETITPISVTKTTSDANPLVGYPDGHVLESGEKVVYDYDNDVFVGWHKEQIDG